MPLQGHTCKKPTDLLTEDEVERIHCSTLRLLTEVGVVFSGDRALDLLAGGGCEVDRVSGRVRFPGQLVEECIAECPNRFAIRARRRDYDLEVGGERLYFQSHPGLYLLDLESGERRLASPKEFGPLVRLLDALDEIHLVITPTVTLSGVPAAVMVEWATAELLRHTQKVTAGGVFDGCARWVVEMAAATDQQVYGQINSVSPLHYSAEQVEGALEYVQAGHPICILPAPTVGANSPATLAGTLVLQNAEQLAGVVLIQLARPGAPVTLASYPHLLDMRTGALCIGAVEVGLLGAATAQLGRRYNIPSHPEFPLTDSKTLDEQAAMEKAMTALLLAMAGANMISNGGGLETERVWSPVQLVIDDEINSMVGRVLDGITVNEQTLALDILVEAGPGGNFLRAKHTKRSWRGEQFLPRLADRLGHAAWEAQGCRDIVERARERAIELVRVHQVPALPEDQDRELDRIIRAAEREKLRL